MSKKLLFFLLLPVIGTGQVQIGQDINGISGLGMDRTGDCVSFSADGNYVAVGASRGNIRVFKNVSGNLTQVGNTIYGDLPNDYTGFSLSLSADGSVLAAGAPLGGSGYVKVYNYVSGAWTSGGQTINGNATGDTFGWRVSLSSDGNTLAIGATGGINDPGYTSIYKNLSGVWTQVGNNIYGKMSGDSSGSGVSLSSDGSVVAIGAFNNSNNGIDSGHVRIYKNISGVWTQVGNDIDGEAAGDLSGWNVSLSSDGSTVAIGAQSNRGKNDVFNAGHVRVYKNVSGNWMQIGQDIDGETVDGLLGYSVALSSDGNILAVGVPSVQPYMSPGIGVLGIVRIYRNISNVWTQIGNDLFGKETGDLFGFSVSISSNGSTLAVGAPGYDGNTLNSGYARIYDLSGILSLGNFISEKFNIFPNPVSDVVTITNKENIGINKVDIYDLKGQLIKSYNYGSSESEIHINTEHLITSTYLLHIETKEGTAVKKVIKK